jgi:hypothetical protein
MMIATTQLNRLSAKSAFYVGFPIALLFSTITILALFFAPAEMNISLPDDDVLYFWVGFLAFIPIISGYFLWKGGKKIKYYLDRDYSTLQSSFYFTARVNFRIFLWLSFVIVAAGALYNWRLNQFYQIEYRQTAIALSITATTLFTTTVIGTFTTGLLTVQIIKILITSAKADLSLSEYAM